ncbi:putative LLM family oxidoreductase [Rathayibacter sp. PhB127]|uniref:LLM class flavin-dependent oxidoreductase n=1 Tax=Rathayibacter sp. PhB127 TaxID=2485176 RepID=UPI000F4D21F7|nr:LLM class flavin-dependent oxidoreductase [Rathayibacter sp. PhB127]ROS20798.1 putative LLM family oxidoreductase [Rathayibacter sp. PhB127]
MSTHEIKFGVDTFGDVTAAADGTLLSHGQVLRDVVEEGVLADEVGLDFFGVGEHHRADFAVSAPDVVLAAIAAKTERIHLGSAVTVLSSDDPVRVYQRFATLDGLSNGRAEVILGRGSFTESFPLFGLDLSQYEVLFEEKLELFHELVQGGPVTWQGTVRPALTEQSVYPTMEGDRRLRTWIGVGGSPESVVRAARFGFPLVLAIIGGAPARFRPYVDLFGRALDQLEQPRLPVAVHSPGFIADTDEEAHELYFGHYKGMLDSIGRERGWAPLTRERFAEEAGPEGALHLGSPETVARKIANTVGALGIDRFDLKYSAGTLPHAAIMRNIELYGTQVIPRVRELLADR